MVDPATGVRPRPAPWGLLGMLALLAVCEAGLKRHGEAVINNGAAHYRLARRAVPHAAGKRLLFLGDSMIKQGIVPRVIEQETGRPTYNLAVTGGQMPVTYYLLRAALARGARPEAIVIDCKANILAADIHVNTRNLPFVLDLGEMLDLAITTRDASFLGLLATGRFLPSYGFRSDLRESLLLALRGQAKDRQSGPTEVRNWRINQGAILNPPRQRPDLVAEPTETEKRVYLPPRWGPDPVCGKYLLRLMKLAHERDIPVFWVIPPIRPDLQAKREQRGLDDRYDKVPRNAQSRFPNLVVLDARHAGYEPSLFFDQAHLQIAGAMRFSADLGAALRERLGQDGAPRWAHLKATSTLAATEPHEDLVQSRLRLGLGPGELQRTRR